MEPSRPVLTHGEPHPGNFIRAGEGLALVDWDTVALGHPERDLWMLDNGSGSAWATYEELSGRTIDGAVAGLYRLAWILTDLASYLKVVRVPHDHGADAQHAATMVQRLLTEKEPSPYGPTKS
jgi:spectinomycin phosphotransferase